MAPALAAQPQSEIGHALVQDTAAPSSAHTVAAGERVRLRIEAAPKFVDVRGSQLAVKPAELNRFLKPILSTAGFELDEIQDSLSFGDRPAWAMYYRSHECQLQICWSARDGGIDFTLAPLDAPTNSGSLADRSNGSSC